MVVSLTKGYHMEHPNVHQTPQRTYIQQDYCYLLEMLVVMLMVIMAYSQGHLIQYQFLFQLLLQSFSYGKGKT